MSYLDWPRIHLGGTFFTDPSTVNNDPDHYKADNTRPSPWQDPKGLHRFKFVDVKVQGAIDQNGNFLDSDPVIGIVANSTDQPSAAKIVDLDVYQQGVSTIFGFQLQLSFSGSVNIVGTMDPCCVNGLWWQRVLPTRGWQAWDGYANASFGGDTYASGQFQSWLRIKPSTWPANTGSVLDQLRAATTTDSNGNLLVSIRMVLDSYNNVPWHPDFQTGRVVATLGPVLSATELPHIPGGRWADPYTTQFPATPKQPWYCPAFYSAPFKFAQQQPSGIMRLTIDMADAIAMQQVGGPPVPLGQLTAYLSSGPTALGTFQVTQDLYQNLGGIVDLQITQAQWNAQFNETLLLVTNRSDLGGVQNSRGYMLWRENPLSLVIDANDQVFRLEGIPGQTAVARVNVSKFGSPAAGATLDVEVVPVTRGNMGASVPWSAGYDGDSNTPAAKNALKATISAPDGDGNCNVTLQVQNDPGSRTSQLDGQLYFVMPYQSGTTPPNMNKEAPRQESMISVVVYSQYQYSNPPTWEEVKAIMTPYAKLYPGMTDQIDLTQEQAFFTFACNPPWKAYDAEPYILPDKRKISAGAIPYYLTRAFNDARYMPVTRDMSESKFLCVMYYIAWLQTAVQPPQSPANVGGRP
jgi:hypothetical protein